MTKDYINICIDCAFISANGTRGGEFPDGVVEAYAKRANEMGREPILATIVSDEGSEYESHFSLDSCEFCGSKLGGDRYRAVLSDGR